MKTIVFIALILALSFSQKVNINLYYESLCPYCKDFIVGTFKTAINTQGFNTICNYNFFPYGNAHEKQVGSTWQFTCQHGTSECEGNLWESCVLNLVPFPQSYQLIVCLEAYYTSRIGWQAAVQHCAPLWNASYVTLQQCYIGFEGNAFQHQFALATDALNPPHQYVPWITVNGQHNDDYQDQVQTNMLKFVCQNYKGSSPIAACDPYTLNQQETQTTNIGKSYREFLKIKLQETQKSVEE